MEKTFYLLNNLKTGDCIHFSKQKWWAIVSKFLKWRHGLALDHTGTVGKTTIEGGILYFDFYESCALNPYFKWYKNPIKFLRGITLVRTYSINEFINHHKTLERAIYYSELKQPLTKDTEMSYIKDLDRQATKEHSSYLWLQAIFSPINQSLPKFIQKIFFKNEIDTNKRFCSLLPYIGLYKIGIISQREWEKDYLTDPVELSRQSCFKDIIEVK